MDEKLWLCSPQQVSESVTFISLGIVKHITHFLIFFHTKRKRKLGKNIKKRLKIVFPYVPEIQVLQEMLTIF